MVDGRARPGETAELRRLRRRIDALDRKLVALLNERATVAREAGRAKAAAGRGNTLKARTARAARRRTMENPRIWQAEGGRQVGAEALNPW